MLKEEEIRQLSYNLFHFIFLQALLTQNDENKY